MAEGDRKLFFVGSLSEKADQTASELQSVLELSESEFWTEILERGIASMAWEIGNGNELGKFPIDDSLKQRIFELHERQPLSLCDFMNSIIESGVVSQEIELMYPAGRVIEPHRVGDVSWSPNELVVYQEASRLLEN